MINFRGATAFVLITNKSSTFLENSLECFVNEFIEKFEKEVTADYVYDLSLFNEIIPVLRAKFGLSPLIKERMIIPVENRLRKEPAKSHI